jgi:hypothetical protein
MTSVITLHGTETNTLLSNYLDTNYYSTVEMSQAIIPLAYYYVSGQLHNNHIRVATIDKDNKYTDETVVRLPDGLCTVYFKNSFERMVSMQTLSK